VSEVLLDDYARAVQELVERIRPLLAFRHPAVVGAVLAELTEIWIAGHVDAELQSELLDLHMWQIRANLALRSEEGPIH
jgi:hypothetical protein